MDADIFLGTSGFSYDHWSGTYYPANLARHEWLTFYSRDFNAVEINATFYKLQSARTFARWKGETPASFRFSIKGSRYITHLKKFRDARDAVKRFYEPASELGEKFAVTLWQTPPEFQKNLSILGAFITVIKEEAPVGVRQAFEFRSKDWLANETFSLLDAGGCAVVIADSDRYPAANDIVCGGFSYLRFHGRAESGYEYREKDLRGQADKISRRHREGLDVYAFFNNDTRAYAVKNAKSLRALIDDR